MNSVHFEKLLEKLIFGDINITEYRNERAKLVQKIIYDPNKADIKPQVNVDLSKDQTQIINKKTDFQVPTLKKQPIGLSSSIWKILIIILLIIAATMSWYFSESEHFKSAISEKIIQGNNIEGSSQKTTIIDEPFILNFNQTKSWDSESVSNFLVQWQSLSRTQQSLARQSDSFSELNTILQEKIQQQRNANKDIDKNKTATREENLLIWFASQLSIGLK